MYCPKCWYDLQSIESGACPECGRAFDPATPRTYDPFRPRRFASLVTLLVAVAWAALVQLGVVIGRELIYGWPAWLDGLGVVAFLLGAGAAGWYAKRPLAFAGCGLFSAASVAIIAHQNDHLRGWNVTALSPAAKGAAIVGLWLVFAAASIAAGRTGWRAHAWWHRFRATHELRYLPRPRTVALASIGLVLLAIGGATFETLRVARGEPVIAVDYNDRIDRMRAERAGVTLEAGHRAWVELARLATEADRIVRDAAATTEPSRPGRDTGQANFSYVVDTATIPADADRERRVLAEMRRAGLFAGLRRYADGPIGLRPLVPTGQAAGSFRRIPFARELAQARIASMRLALVDGDFDEIAGAFDESMAIAQTISYQGTGVDAAMGSIAATAALRELHRELAEAAFPAATCRTLLETLDRRLLAPIELTVEGERLESRERIQRTHTDDGAGDGYAIPGLAAGIGQAMPTPPRSEATRFFLAFQSRFVQASRREEVALVDEFADTALREARRPLHEQWRDPATVAAAERPIDRRYAMGSLFMPRPQAMMRRQAQVDLAFEAGRALVAIELFIAEHGRPPASLDELVPTPLRAVPIDAFSGRPLCYRVEDDADGPTFVLYSTGRDGVDDGGTFNAAEPHQARLADSVGLDLPLVIPRAADPRPGG